ncbi:MAG: hypothetical protein AAGC60_26290 [Acidobacteriota bacterium]
MPKVRIRFTGVCAFALHEDGGSARVLLKNGFERYNELVSLLPILRFDADRLVNDDQPYIMRSNRRGREFFGRDAFSFLRHETIRFEVPDGNLIRDADALSIDETDIGESLEPTPENRHSWQWMPDIRELARRAHIRPELFEKPSAYADEIATCVDLDKGHLFTEEFLRVNSSGDEPSPVRLFWYPRTDRGPRAFTLLAAADLEVSDGATFRVHATHWDGTTRHWDFVVDQPLSVGIWNVPMTDIMLSWNLPWYFETDHGKSFRHHYEMLSDATRYSHYPGADYEAASTTLPFEVANMNLLADKTVGCMKTYHGILRW